MKRWWQKPKSALEVRVERLEEKVSNLEKDVEDLEAIVPVAIQQHKADKAALDAKQAELDAAKQNQADPALITRLETELAALHAAFTPPATDDSGAAQTANTAGTGVQSS